MAVDLEDDLTPDVDGAHVVSTWVQLVGDDVAQVVHRHVVALHMAIVDVVAFVVVLDEHNNVDVVVVDVAGTACNRAAVAVVGLALGHPWDCQEPGDAVERVASDVGEVVVVEV